MNRENKIAAVDYLSRDWTYTVSTIYMVEMKHFNTTETSSYVLQHVQGVQDLQGVQGLLHVQGLQEVQGVQ